MRTALRGFFYSLTNKLYLMCDQSFESTKIAENLKNYHLLRNNYLQKLLYLCWV